MPTRTAEQREDRVVELVIGALVRTGHSVSLLDRPDRNSHRIDGLTVDAELAVNEFPWAVDVTTLRWRQTLEGAVKKLETRLEREFGDQLKASGQTLSVICHVSTDEAVIASLVELARKTIITNTIQIRRDEASRLFPSSRDADVGLVEVQPWLGQSANLHEEIVLSLGRAFEKKLKRQLFRTRKLGYRTCLVIDQQGSPDLRFEANFLPMPETILAAIEDVEAAAGHSLDTIALVREGDAVLWLRP
jgi:hypothetical protein